MVEWLLGIMSADEEQDVAGVHVAVGDGIHSTCLSSAHR